MRRGSHSLMDELKQHADKTVLIGIRSSFFFVGPGSEAIQDMRLLSLMAKHCVALVTNRFSEGSLGKDPVDIGAREVVRTYVRNPDDGGDEMVILIKGSEFGAFWTRAEYLSCRRLLLQAMERVVA